MLGFLIGTVCLVGLIKVIRGHRGWRRGWGPSFGYGGSCSGGSCGSGYGGYGGYGGHGPYRGGDERGYAERGSWGGRGRGFGGPSFLLRGLFEQLDTTPGQEKVIKAAIDDLRAAAHKAKDEIKGARPDLARAFRSEIFDETSVGETVARVEGASDSLRKAFIDAFAKVHGALDEKQRARLADWLERSPGFGRWM